ncbi:MAG: zf-HC2 domain-containing protein [Planctomycetes bacterium]|nr:zf-HC2 domain-containing protein [Planctomycetota bacterium]
MEPKQPICRRVRENLSAYLDGELKGGARRLIDEHLAECPECRAQLDTLKETWRLLDELEEPIVRNDFRREVLARAQAEMRAEETAKAGGRRSLLAGFAASAAAAVFLFGLFASSRPLSDLPTPREREAITYLEVLENVDALLCLDRAKELQALGQTIEPAAPATPSKEGSGV